MPDWWESRYFASSTNALPQTPAANQFSNLQSYWLGLDPTNGIAMGGDHIVMAVGRDYLDIAPIDGVFNGYGAQEIFVEVDVEAVAD